MCRLPDDFQLLALALLSMADDEGYFHADPSIVRGEVMPFRESLARIREGLDVLREKGWIELADHPEQGLIGRIAKWGRHQKVDHPSLSKLKDYFTRESIENRREELSKPRESLALDQGSGIKDQGTGIKGHASPRTPPDQTTLSQSERIPADLHPLQYASRLLQELGMPETKGNNTIVSASISALVREGRSAPAAYEFLLAKAKDERDEGADLNKFWFEDSKWRSNGKSNRAERRQADNLAAREAARTAIMAG
jgi:hypothetical protein